MKKLLLPIVVIILAAVALWVYSVRNQAPEVPFAKARREMLVSALTTNGKVEPLRWQDVRAEEAGAIAALPVHQGQQVQAGQTIAAINVPGLQADLQAAEARVAQAQAELATIEAGGKASELTDIDNSLAKARLDREEAQRDYASIQRLYEKQAATAVDVAAARSKLRQAELDIEGLQRRRQALIGRNDRGVAEARLRDAQAAVNLARSRIGAASIHAPIAGDVYALPVRVGTYLNVGDLVAQIGELGQLRVHIYVDEPELGRVAAGQPVTITWTALPGKTWTGTVQTLPTEIVPLGTRQVGDVLATIANPGHDLVPGTNVDVEIRTNVAQNAVTIPKEALRRQAGQVGVFLLQPDSTIVWRPIATGASSITRVQVLQGLSQSDAVALPTDVPLRGGEKVQPLYP